MTQPEHNPEQPELTPRRGMTISAVNDESADSAAAVGSPTVLGQHGRIGSRYELLEEIGVGGMGVVFRARDILNPTGPDVAVKTLLKKYEHDPKIAVRFNREMLSIQSLEHPHIVEVLDISNRPEARYYVMPFYRRGSLDRMIKERGFLDLKDALRFARQVATALRHAHDRDIRHGDIKPSNLLLDDQGRVRVSDFGLARDFSVHADVDDCPSSAWEGTLPYMPIGMLEGRGQWHLADIYMYGATVYEFLTGRAPYCSDKQDKREWVFDIIRQIREGRPPPVHRFRSDTPELLVRIVERAMTEHPTDRYATINGVLHDLNLVEDRILGSPDPAAPAFATAPVGEAPVESGDIVLLSHAQVSSAERTGVGRRWRTRRTSKIATLFLGAALLLVVARLALFAGQQARITDARIDATRPTIIEVWRDKKSEPEAFYDLPEQAGRLSAVERLSLGPNGPQAVVASVQQPGDGNCLIMLDAQGKIMARWNLSSDRRWPDCGPPTQWNVACLLVADVDGVVGDEIVVVAHDSYEYPCRVSIIDPRTHAVSATFWHVGQLASVFIESDFFGTNHPALVVSGTNNKLDGFNAVGLPYPLQPYEPRPGEDRPLTRFGRVHVVLILDPRNMNGVGPPRTPETEDLAGAQPFTYAFLDAPAARVDHGADGTLKGVTPGAEEVAMIRSITRAVYSGRDARAPWFAVGVERPGADIAQEQHRAVLRVDRDLRLWDVVPADEGAGPATAEYWRGLWRLVIQEGEYVGQ